MFDMMMNSFSNSLRHPDKLFSGFRLLLIGISLLFSICASAQFLINGVQPSYDRRTHSFLMTIPQIYWGNDYQATISLTADSAWENAVVDG